MLIILIDCYWWGWFIFIASVLQMQGFIITNMAFQSSSAGHRLHEIIRPLQTSLCLLYATWYHALTKKDTAFLALFIIISLGRLAIDSCACLPSLPPKNAAASASRRRAFPMAAILNDKRYADGAILMSFSLANFLYLQDVYHIRSSSRGGSHIDYYFYYFFSDDQVKCWPSLHNTRLPHRKESLIILGNGHYFREEG